MMDNDTDIDLTARPAVYPELTHFIQMQTVKFCGPSFPRLPKAVSPTDGNVN